MKLTAPTKKKSLIIFFAFLRAILICIAYAILWVVLWESSQAFWYLPAGLRFTILVFTKPSKWPVWIAGEWLAILYLNDVHTNYASIFEYGIGNFAPAVIYAVTIWLVMRKREWPDNTVRSQAQVISISTAMTIAAVGTAIALFILMPNDSPFLSFERFSIQGIATYSLGDIAGILFVWSFIEFIRSARPLSRSQSKLLGRDVLLVVVPILALVIFLTMSTPSFGWAILAVVFIPVVYLSIKSGWVGAALSIVLLNIVAGVLFLISGNAEALFNAQLLLVSVGITGLFLGAAISQQNELFSNLRSISQRVIQTQENERSRISKDLHDHVGQVLTALRLRIAVLHKKKVSDVGNELESLDKLAAEAYQDVRDIVNELSPNELIQFGLQRSLENPGFHQMLRTANIKYNTDFKGQVIDIPEHIQLTLYRITQEVLSNVAKHSKATDCTLEIHVTEDNEKRYIEYKVQDNGTGFDTDKCNQGHGIQNIQDRAQALAGTMTLMSSDKGTSIAIVIPN
jgi:two-component system sensor histidine kinase UhpB